MHRGRLVFATIIWQGIAACGRGAPETTPHQQPAEEALEAPAETEPAQSPIVELVGDWELRSEPPQRMPGLHLTVTVDSVSGNRYFGRLSNYFSGDVGVDPQDFEPFADSVQSDRTTVFAMPTTDREMLGIVMEGTLTTDTVWLDLFVLGPDTLSNAARRWALVKNR